MQLRHLPPLPPAQVLNGLSMYQSCAWEVCCLTFAHPYSVKKSLHTHSLCIQSLNMCPDSPVVPHASTHTCMERLGIWEPSLRHPQIPVSVLLHKLCQQSSVLSLPDGARSVPTVTSTQTWMWSHTCTHICALFTAVPLSSSAFMYLCVCTVRESVHPPYSQEGVCMCVCA